MRFPTVAPLLFAALLLSPIHTLAQTPAVAKASFQEVSLQVTFVTVNTADLDALGINFDLIPLPASPRTFLACATGSIVSQRYQTLIRAADVNIHVITLDPITVSENVPAEFAVDAQVPAYTVPNAAEQLRFSFPQLSDTLQIRGKITLIPQIAPGNLVKLDIISPVGSNQRMRFGTIPSGQQVVMNAAIVKLQNSTNFGQMEGFSGHNRISRTMELLIFITPTLITKTPAAAAGFSSFTPGTTGFPQTKPSDVLQPTHWLSPLGWLKESYGDETKSRPRHSVKTPVLNSLQRSGIRRIFAS